MFGAIIDFFHSNIMYLNNSKLFAGIIMIMLNVGSKFITINFSKSTEEHLKQTVSKQILVFAMSWMGTRDIYTATILTVIFTIISEYLFNEESKACIIPHKYRLMHTFILDKDGDGEVSDDEISSAIALLEKAKEERRKKNQHEIFGKFANLGGFFGK
jgi:hypothetical protein